MDSGEPEAVPEAYPYKHPSGEMIWVRLPLAALKLNAVARKVEQAIDTTQAG